MTFQTQIAADIAGIMADSEGPAVSVTYEPTSGVEESIRAIIRPGACLDPNGYGQSPAAVAVVKIARTEEPEPGAIVRDGNDTWRVSRILGFAAGLWTVEAARDERSKMR